MQQTRVSVGLDLLLRQKQNAFNRDHYRIIVSYRYRDNFDLSYRLSIGNSISHIVTALATSCNYVTLSLSTHTGCRMHIQFCAIISSIFYVCDVIVVEICPYKVANLQLWSKNFKWNWVYLCSQPSDVTI